MPVLAPGQIQQIRLGGNFSNICWSSLITGSLFLREMKYTSQHFCDKTMDDKRPRISNAVFQNVHNHGK